MAKVLDLDSTATSSKEREGFLRDLQTFHDSRGTPFKRNPVIGGREVDLHLLYSLVTAQGGWIKVNAKNGWGELLEHFKLPIRCVNASIALKQLYLRYLDRWEKVHFLGEEADRGDDEDEESRHKRWSARVLHSVPLTYNYSQHNVADTSREYNHLSTDLYKASDYDRLALSLLSPLPNEQDFAINVCTLLSNDGKHTLKLEKYPRIINFLLAHAGVFHHKSMRKLFVHTYGVVRKHPIHHFWNDVLESEDFKDLTDEDNFTPPSKKTDKHGTLKDKTDSINESVITEETVKELNKLGCNEPMDIDCDPVVTDSADVSTSEVNISTSDCDVIGDSSDSLVKDKALPRIKLKIEPEDKGLFCVSRGLGTQEYIGQRVLQIATILRNLSFIEENIKVLVKNKTFVRFLLLCCTSQWCHLKNVGFDILGNLAPEFVVKDLPNDRLCSALIKIIANGLNSQDRSSCISSLEVLNKLSQNEANEDTLLRNLEASVYRKVCSFLTIHDVMLLIYTLECLYSLSSLGERSCNFIVNNHGVVDTLVSLVTVEGKSYGPKACIGMKLVETVTGVTPSNSAQSTAASSPTSTSTTTASSSTATSTTSTSTTSSTTTPIVSTSPTTRVTPPSTPSAPNTPVRVIQPQPQRLVLPSSTPTPPTATPVSTASSTSTIHQPMTPQQLIQQQHAHQQAIHENEQFALAWLRATYEPCVSGKVDHQELYKHYMNSCSKIGRKGVISPLHFPRCVRSVFGGTVGPNPMKSSNSNDPQYYEGIKVRDKPLIINMQPVSTPTSQSVISISKNNNNRRKLQPQPVTVTASQMQTPTLSISADASECTTPVSPASPILKAQLSAPPKQREVVPVTAASKGDIKSQVMAHPHLSQALLGTAITAAQSTVTSSPVKDTQQGQSNTSLIKSLLATKVNDCMTTMSMRTTTDCQNVAQVAARQQQQRLLAQQTTVISSPDPKLQSSTKMETPKICRMNGARQLFTDSEIGDPSVSSTSQFTTSTKGKKEPPQPPPPPLAPLTASNNKNRIPKIENEDSDSIGNNSLASSTGMGTVGVGGVSSTEEGDNSLTSFEGLLNGVPNLDNPLNEDTNSKDSVKIIGTNEILKNKPLRLADLLEKKFDKSPPLLNGSLGKELKLGERPMDLVENHIEKALTREVELDCAESIEIAKLKIETIEMKEEISEMKMEIIDVDDIKDECEVKHGIKRPANDDLIEPETKKPLLSNNINGTSSAANSPAPGSVSSSNGDDGPSTVSTAAAKLFADIAADILEDEDEEQLMQEAQNVSVPQPVEAVNQPSTPMPQIIMDNNQQMILAQPRQIIVSQAQIQQQNSVVFTQGTPMKTQSGQTVIVQNSSQHRAPVVLQQAGTGQLLLSQGLQGLQSLQGLQGLQGSVQLVASPANPGQYVLQASNTGGTYVVAQQQTAVVHGQPQTVLVAQTPQQQGTTAKTIIILQQPPSSHHQGSATHHQKVMMTPQGQQVVVTQVPRPIVHTSSVSNNAMPTQTVIRPNPTVSTVNSPTSTIAQPPVIIEKKPEEPPKPQVRQKPVRDANTPFVCEWGDCNVDIKFKSANQVYLHACAAHCPTGSEEIICQWDRCDNMKRKRFSLMTHLHDKHCNTEAMRQNMLRRKQMSHSGKSETPSASSTTPHPGYAPDAALHAIKRHALEFVNPKELQLKPCKLGTASAPIPVTPRPGPPPPTEQDDNEGPVTKSIRLTASLILRNLVIYSSNCRRYLKHYEPHLANVALSNVESSRTIAQVLYDMNEGSNHR